jgi:ankyrin repeat protein
MAEAQLPHPIFIYIVSDLLLATAQQLVLADAGVLEERWSDRRVTPLMAAIFHKKKPTAISFIQHRGQHDLETADNSGWTALHWASARGPLEVVQALVAAGANPAALTGTGSTPLIHASSSGRTDIVAYLLQQPAVKARIDHINQHPDTALSRASRNGRQPIVQLLLDAGADPTLPAGQKSPLRQAFSNNHEDVAALLRKAINEAKRARECVAWLGKGRRELFEDLLVEMRGHLVHAWADKGVAGVL